MIALPIGRQAHNIAGLEIGELQPIFGDIARREQIIFAVFALQRVEQILLRNRRFIALLNGTFDREFLRAFNDGGNDGPTGEITAIQIIVASAAIGDVEEAIAVAL